MAAPNTVSSGGALNPGLGATAVTVNLTQPNAMPTYLPPTTISRALPSSSAPSNPTQVPSSSSQTSLVNFRTDPVVNGSGPVPSPQPLPVAQQASSAGSTSVGGGGGSQPSVTASNDQHVSAASNQDTGPGVNIAAAAATSNGLPAHGGAGAGLQMRSPKDRVDGVGGSNGQPKLPILRLKKRGDDDGTFEKQESSKNDSYCWVCHDGGDVLCCDKCPRVFHLDCCNLDKPPDDEDNEWVCSVCQNIARKTKRSRPPNLNELLKLAVERMSFPGTEIFRIPVHPDIMSHYREYIFHPMHLGTLKQKIKNSEYQSTREFLHDTEWILHNCTIYNGGKHALTKIAKNIVKVCMEDMREIELCPGCYSLTVKQPPDWFCIPCNPPHPVVLAKVRGYPLWPAKLISETKDKCDVRFFGQHDRSLVPKSEIQVLSGLPPKPSSKTKHWNLAMHELKMYGANVESQRSDAEGKGDKSILLAKKKDKTGVLKQGAKKVSPLKPSTTVTTHHSSAQVSTTLVPPIVQVTGESGKEDAAPNLASELDVSSPGTPPSLQIDLEGGSSRNNKSPNRGRPNPSGGMNLYDGSRSSQVTGTLNGGNNNMPVVVTNTPGGQPSVHKKKMGKAGAYLSDVISSLTKKRLVSGHGASEGGGAGGGGAPAVSGPPTSDAATETVAKQKTAVTTEGSQATSSPFSSIYVSSNKTAIAVVDPNNPRRPKRKAPKGSAPSDSPAAKKPRVGGATTPAATAGVGSGSTDLNNLSNPAAYVAMIQEYGSAVIGALSKSTSPAPPSAPVSSAATAPATTPVTSIRSEVTAPATTGATSSPVPPSALPDDMEDTSVDVTDTSVTESPVAAVSIAPGATTISVAKPRAVGLASKKKRRLDKNRGKSSFRTQGAGGVVKPAVASAQKTALPANSVVSALAAAIATTVPASHPSAPTTSAISSVAAQVPSSSVFAGGSSTRVSQLPVSSSQSSLTTRHDSPASSSGSADVRGDIAGDIDSGINMDFGVGNSTDLMADTMRRVNSSFVTRVNQMTGVTEDMGYNYFMEKLMSSVKNVLVEMLSTFESKGRMSAKQLREQLHQCWPVSNSASAMEQLGKELREEMKQSLEVVRASAALQLEQVVSEVRRQVEKEKEIAVAETKKKKWCSYCYKEAQYNCCYNAYYCNEDCQRADWDNHSSSCTQRTKPSGKGAGDADVSSPVDVMPPQQRTSEPLPPSQHPSTSIDHHMVDATAGAGQQDGGSGTSNIEPHSFLYSTPMLANQQQQQQQVGPSSTDPHSQQSQQQAAQQQQAQQLSNQAYMQAMQVHSLQMRSQVQQQQQQQGLRQEHQQGLRQEHQQGLRQEHQQGLRQEHQQSLRQEHQQGLRQEHQQGLRQEHQQGLRQEHQQGLRQEHQQSLRQEHQQGLRQEHQQGLRQEHQQSLRQDHQQGLRQEHHIHGLHSHQMEGGPPPPPSASHLASSLVDHQVSSIGGVSSGGVDHHPDGMITTANTASPPVHIQNLLLNQHQQQSSSGGTSSKGGASGVIAGANSLLMSHQSSANPHHPGMHSSAMGTGTLLIPNDYHVPILPAMQATTPTSQNHTFFNTAF